MFRKVLLLSAALAIGASVGSITPAHASLSLDTRSGEIYAKVEPVGIKSAQTTPATATDAGPAKSAPVATSAATSTGKPSFRRAAPKRVAVTAVSLGYNRGHAIVHGVAY